MFDVGFSEIVLIGVVALIVIGPERLPKAARTMGLLFGRLQRYVGEVKADISREMELDELRKLQKQVQGAAQEFKTSVESAAQNVHAGVREVESELNAAAAEASPAQAQATGLPDLVPGASEPPAVHGANPSDAAGADAAAANASRQTSLPGFDKI